MTALHETAYPRLKPDPSPKELEEVYTPTQAELEFVATLGKRPLARVGLLLQLKLFQRLGYFSGVTDVPEIILDHIVAHAGVARRPTPADLKRFEASGSRQATMPALRKYLNVRRVDDAGFAWLHHVAETAAETRHVVADIINVMLEELVHHRYELPAFSTLDRIAIQAREKINAAHFSGITDQLGTEARLLIDSLLKVQPDEVVSGWQLLKREPKRPTNKETRSYIQHIRRLQHLVEQLPKPNIPVPKLKQYRHLARSLDAAEMAELGL